MSDEDDILQKADALLHRRAVRHEPDFPVLTEVVDTFPASIPAPAASEIKGADLAERSLTISHIDIEEIENRILERILPAIEFQLAQLIRSTLLPQVSMLLEDAIERAAEDLSSSMARHAAEQLSDTIMSKMQDELSKLGSRISDS